MQGLFDREGTDLRESIAKSEREIDESCSVERPGCGEEKGGKKNTTFQWSKKKKKKSERGSFVTVTVYI